MEGFCRLNMSLRAPKEIWKTNKKMRRCKRNITFIISCQFQTGLRIRELSSDSCVFVLSWLEKCLLECVLYLGDRAKFIWHPLSSFFFPACISWCGKWNSVLPLKRYSKLISASFSIIHIWFFKMIDTVLCVFFFFICLFFTHCVSSEYLTLFN